jgi:hypothetical protein
VQPYYTLPDASTRMLAAEFKGSPSESDDDSFEHWKTSAAREAVEGDPGSRWFTNANIMRDHLLTPWVKRKYFNNWPDRELLSAERRRAVETADGLVARAIHVANELARTECTGMTAKKYLEEVRKMSDSKARRDRAAWIEMVWLVDGTAKHLAYYRKKAIAIDDRSTVYLASWCRGYRETVTDEHARDAINGWMKAKTRWKSMRTLAVLCGFEPPQSDVMRRQYSDVSVSERKRSAEFFARAAEDDASSKE